MGRPAASAPQFSYTQALRESKLTWDAATLKRFLGAPAGVVPGTSMALAVPDEAERDNLIAYFQSVSTQAPAAAQAIVVPDSSAQSANWRLDAPGRVHRITVASLPPPFATPSSRNSSSVVPKPASATLALPPGFQIEPFATGLAGPRKMLIAPNGDILVTEISGGRVTVLHPTPDGRHAGGTDVYLKGLKQPFGLAFYPNAQNPQWLYVAETNRVTRYAYQVGDVKPRGETQIVVPQLPSGVGHSTRDIAFSPDGKQLFVSVGSGSNVADTMSKKTPEEIKSWEAQHGLGAAWDIETDRSAQQGGGSRPQAQERCDRYLIKGKHRFRLPQLFNGPELGVSIEPPLRLPTWAGVVGCYHDGAFRTCATVVANLLQPGDLLAGVGAKQGHSGRP